ncbi:OLC1v1034102C1 [Oldenlandia corymbosa var. corymbosa]|uniref:HVA22-like protein n=1 Tax=Oldenlandia corymbosa var. corymbosa TaxID=529605 RepID=A0AAV1CSY5_OLDCO|nr:OLC1v1034102C1 [Oldenlandia corymbosa var. corymbosa]
MLGEFITRVLVLVLGYAYPAFECFKTVEKNRVEIEELRYWCQYWILVAVVTVTERICDILVSWVPMYWEMKLALFIYLWYPKAKGSGYVYDTLLKPYMIKHESDIDRNLVEFRARAWDLLVYYWENCTQLGQSTFFQLLDFLFTNVVKLRQPILQRPEVKDPPPPAPPSTPPPVPPSPSNTPSSATTGGGLFRRNRNSFDRRRPPLPPQSPFSSHRSVAQPTPSESVQVHLHEETQFVRTEEHPSEIEMDLEKDSDSSRSPPKSAPSEEHKHQHNLNQHLNLARLKLRRSKGFH